MTSSMGEPNNKNKSLTTIQTSDSNYINTSINENSIIFDNKTTVRSSSNTFLKLDVKFNKQTTISSSNKNYLNYRKNMEPTKISIKKNNVKFCDNIQSAKSSKTIIHLSKDKTMRKLYLETSSSNPLLTKSFNNLDDQNSNVHIDDSSTNDRLEINNRNRNKKANPQVRNASAFSMKTRINNSEYSNDTTRKNMTPEKTSRKKLNPILTKKTFSTKYIPKKNYQQLKEKLGKMIHDEFMENNTNKGDIIQQIILNNYIPNPGNYRRGLMYQKEMIEK